LWHPVDRTNFSTYAERLRWLGRGGIMTETVQGVAWLVLFCLVLVARLLTTRPAVRILSPWVRRLVDWGSANLSPREEIDPEIEELAILRRRQQLEANLDRVRRLLATDMGMSRDRQVGNRLAYAWLMDELKRTPDILPAVPTRSVHLISRDVHRGSTVEILEIGWRH
jgi:hypothetical protein